MGMILLIVVSLILLVSAFLWGRRAAAGGVGYYKAHVRLFKAILLGYILFAGCTLFPISSEPFPLDLTKTYLLIVSYGLMGQGFGGLYGRGRGRRVWLLAGLMTAAGMFGRYLLEYGEVSNTYNFTAFNIVAHLVLIPAFTVLSYHFYRGTSVETGR